MSYAGASGAALPLLNGGVSGQSASTIAPIELPSNVGSGSNQQHTSQHHHHSLSASHHSQPSHTMQQSNNTSNHTQPPTAGGGGGGGGGGAYGEPHHHTQPQVSSSQQQLIAPISHPAPSPHAHHSQQQHNPPPPVYETAHSAPAYGQGQANTLPSNLSYPPVSKLFIGGISRDTREDEFLKVFGQFGSIADAVCTKISRIDRI